MLSRRFPDDPSSSNVIHRRPAQPAGGDRARATPHRPKRRNVPPSNTIVLQVQDSTQANCVSTPRFRGLSLASFHLRTVLGCPVKPNPGRQGHPSVRQPKWRSDMDTTCHNRGNARPESTACSTQRCRYAEAFRDDRGRSLTAGTRPVPLPCAEPWGGGTQSRTMIAGFYGVGAEMQHDAPFQASADRPKVLCGEDNGPAPVEWVLHALAACLTAGIANISAARGVTLHSVECSVEGDIDLQGSLVCRTRSAMASRRSVSITGQGRCAEEKLRQIVDQARARSAVFDILTGHVPVTIAVDV
jgi:Predicted redox protein, regulator of disulfide bond formation